MNDIKSLSPTMILEKAAALDIPPRLLSLALACLAENDQVTEEVILAQYRDLVLNELREEALAQSGSNRKKERESAEYALSPARQALVDIVREQSPGFNHIDTYAGKNEPLKNYQLEAWNLITDELLSIKNKYRKVLGKTDLTDIINELCPEEMETLHHQPA
jgi:hypothetical protein